jgi:hypothetical protein
MKSIFNKLAIFSLLLIMTSCAKTCNRQKANGGIIGTYTGEWIVVTYSGNQITDVWKLSNVIVQSEDHSDGWLFVDSNDNAVHVGGNTKAIRVNDKASIGWNDYREYHSEFTKLDYHQYCDSLKKK